eukprot:Seg6152.1 transcript_id=Seg6152.1/GoldUCD/mRNA.D3Y31 product="hypothetical protein" protein_id=Seg6152.1/GoldUCD/D3Y31
MAKRPVFVERTHIDGLEAINAYHWAVKVDDDIYEIERQGSKKDKRNSINGSSDGRPKNERRDPDAFLLLAGATKKSDTEILEFNQNWVREHPDYNALTDNCQTYTLDFVQFLIGGSFVLPIPQAGDCKWANGPNAHAIETEHFAQAKATTGKAGAQWGVFAAEAEGPMAAASVSDDFKSGNFGAFAEASIGRAEGKVGPARLRLEPNLNTGIGAKDGQAQVKVLGFGSSIGKKGFGISTPFGSFGFGNF